jgi:CO dehydrogenase/acetyl-CoA synthase alpha subunit
MLKVMKSTTIVKTGKTKTFSDKDLVTIPRKEYELFSIWKKTVRVHLDEQWFWTPQWQKKEREADKAILAKKVSSQFSNHDELIAELKK